MSECYIHGLQNQFETNVYCNYSSKLKSVLFFNFHQRVLPKCNNFFVFKLKNKIKLIFNNCGLCLIERRKLNSIFTQVSLGRKHLFLACVGNKQYISRGGWVWNLIENKKNNLLSTMIVTHKRRTCA